MPCPEFFTYRLQSYCVTECVFVPLQALFKALGLNDNDFKFGLTKVFFRPGKVQLSQQNELHLDVAGHFVQYVVQLLGTQISLTGEDLCLTCYLHLVVCSLQSLTRS